MSFVATQMTSALVTLFDSELVWAQHVFIHTSDWLLAARLRKMLFCGHSAPENSRTQVKRA